MRGGALAMPLGNTRRGALIAVELRGFSSAEPWLPLGAGVNSGIAYVGNVGGEGTMDFTALGDVVNTASRMQSAAMVGEVVLSESVYAEVADEFPNAQSRALNLRGKEAPVAARVLKV
jgi:adenylate cyclase